MNLVVSATRADGVGGQWAPWEAGKGCRSLLAGNPGGWGAPPGARSCGSYLAFTLPRRCAEGRQGSLVAAIQDQAQRLLGELTWGRFPGFRVVMGGMVVL